MAGVDVLGREAINMMAEQSKVPCWIHCENAEREQTQDAVSCDHFINLRMMPLPPRKVGWGHCSRQQNHEGAGISSDGEP